MKRAIFILSLFFSAFLSSAQSTSKVITLEECRSFAEKHYPAIRQYDLIARTEQFSLSNAARAWLPQLSISGQATWQSEVVAFPEAFESYLHSMGLEMRGLDKDQYKVLLEVNQLIWDGGKYKADREITVAEAEEQKRTADVNMYEVEGKVDNLFFGILLLEQGINQINLKIDLLQSNLEKVCSLQKNGAAMQSDADAIEAEILTSGQQLAQAEASLSSYRKMLEIFTGVNLDGITLECPEMPENKVAERTGDLYDIYRPELNLLDAKQLKIIAQRKMLDAALMPRFAFFAQGLYGYPSMNYFESMLSSDWKTGAIAGIRFQWDISSFYTRKNNLNKLNLAQSRLDVQRDIFLFNTRLQAQQEDGNISRLRKVIEDDNKIVRLRKSVREAAESKLRNGEIDITGLLSKITEESAAIFNRDSHEIELIKSLYELQHTVNSNK